MARKIADQGRASKRPPVGAPSIPLAALRKRLGLTLEGVCERIGEDTGRWHKPATLSAIENGHRGASLEMIEALAGVYEVDPEDIETAYAPRHRTREVAE